MKTPPRESSDDGDEAPPPCLCILRWRQLTEKTIVSCFLARKKIRKAQWAQPRLTHTSPKTSPCSPTAQPAVNCTTTKKTTRNQKKKRKKPANETKSRNEATRSPLDSRRATRKAQTRKRKRKSKTGYPLLFKAGGKHRLEADFFHHHNMPCQRWEDESSHRTNCWLQQGQRDTNETPIGMRIE